jgi:hypothetical protein
MRFKPPPPDSIETIGWRVEFRTAEVFLIRYFCYEIVYLPRSN